MRRRRHKQWKRNEKVSAGQQPRKGLSELIPGFRVIEEINLDDANMQKGVKKVDRWVENGSKVGSTRCKVGRAPITNHFVKEAKS